MTEETATETPEREVRFDVLRNSVDLYGAVYQIISVLAAYGLSGSSLGPFQTEHLCRVATKVLPHLPAPSENANKW